MSDRRQTDTAEIKQLLQAQIVSLAQHLAPEGHRAGKYWIARNPRRDDRRAGSFWVALSGVPGAWRDEATGDKGDVLRLVQYCLALDKFTEALEWSRAWLGLTKMTDTERGARLARARAEAERAAASRANNEAMVLDRNRRAALAQWLEATPAERLAGTAVDRYLKTRGIDLGKLARPARALRGQPCALHLESNRRFPTMLAGMFGPDGDLWAIHRTFLMPDGSGKADVVPARKIWPSFAGAAIPLSRGASGLTTKQAEKQGVLQTLILCEGVEDGLSLALACPDFRVWAAGSLGNLGRVTLPKCVDRVIVAADNDWGKPQAEALLEKGIAALIAQGVEVSVARSSVGKDMNDLLRAGAC